MADIIFDDQIHVDLVQCSTDDAMVINAAKVSTLGAAVSELEPEYVARPGDIGPSTGLINFLMRNRHGTPFEHGMFTFRITVPIFVMRELHRHRIGFSYNEESGRYKTLDPHFYTPSDDRALTQVGKPGHYEYKPGNAFQQHLVQTNIKIANRQAWCAYEEMLDNGIAKEVARMVLPVNIYSACYVTCNPRSLMSFLGLRTRSEEATFKSFPMREIEMMAFQMEDHFAEAMPVTHEAFCKNGRVSP